MSIEATMPGVSSDDHAVMEAIHKKLNPQAAKPAAVAPAAQAATRAQPAEIPVDTELQPAQEPVEEVAADVTPPAEGQTAEGDAPLEEVAPQLFKVEVSGDDGKPVEVEVDFNERKSGYLRHADYTRKTQAVAKERAQIPLIKAESERAATEARTQYAQALQQMQAFVTHAAAPELQGINWNQLSQENPTEYVRLKQRAEHISATYAQIQNHLGQVAKQAQEQQRKANLDAAAQARETLNREIPGGWNDGLYAKITKVAVDHYGYTPEEFSTFVDARAILMANDAMKYRELVSGKPTAQQKVAQAAPLAVKPGAAQTPTDKRQSAVEKARETARKSGSVDDAMALMQAKRRR